MRRMLTRASAVAAVCAIIALISAAPALAHADRVVGKKKWHIAIGWAIEPAYAGYPNAAQIFLHDANDKPVVDLGDTLQVDVGSAGQTMTLSYAPAFEIGESGTPGDYRADLIPTRPGTYTMRVHGTIKGDKVDVSVSCSESTFDCVKAATDAEFPVKDPTNADLNTLIGKGDTRLAAKAKDASDSASTGKTLGYIGIGVGAVALIVALVRGRAPKARV